MEARGMDAPQLARAACLAHSTVWRMLSDDRTSAQLRTLGALAAILRVDVSWLAGRPVAKQLAFWPAPVEADVVSPEQLISRVLRSLNRDLRTRAARAAIASILEVMTASGQTPDAAVYAALLALDSARVAAKGRTKGASSKVAVA
jgi:transcriptional regulator with XRE-family HTH domain